MPDLQYGNSFAENFHSLSEAAKNDVTMIGNRLAVDHNYIPDSLDFPPLRPDDEFDERAFFHSERFYVEDTYRGAICTKLREWEDWYLAWHFEYRNSYWVKSVTLNLTDDPNVRLWDTISPVAKVIEDIRIIFGLGK